MNRITSCPQGSFFTYHIIRRAYPLLDDGKPYSSFSDIGCTALFADITMVKTGGSG